MGLFDKKFCDICGNKIGLLGNKKLEDGNMCKDCQKLLSPWFSDRRHSTVEEIKQQLAYREANKARVADFHVSRSLGSSCKLLLDEGKHQFIVTRSSNWQGTNPDVVDFDQLTGCTTRITEDKDELKTKDAEGKETSYMPPRFRYSYDFKVLLTVNHPYFDDMRFDTASFVREETPASADPALMGHGDVFTAAKADLLAIQAWANELLGTDTKTEIEDTMPEVTAVPAPEAAPAAAPAEAPAPAYVTDKNLFVFPALPKTREELLALPRISFQDPFSIAAAAVAAFTRFPEDPEACYDMLDALKGPQPLSTMDKSFIRDRFYDGKDYVPRSYFDGAVPENDYTPQLPIRIRVKESVHSRDLYDQGYITLYVKSGGADSDRALVLRHKPSTDEWFLWNHTGILADVRVPVSADPWA
ncbi:MAG: DUF4428 domain-containing protein [Lachnospiraceae bacterium]|nr:DUF4428 domain-containing protein [Lachnospiraceae bacterium]